jgi:uncharacterized protein YhfF
MLVLLLDRTHHCLLADVPASDPDRPLRAVDAWFAARGVTLPPPAGSRARHDAGRDFAFVLDRVPAPAGLTWRPLPEASADDDLWRLYVQTMLGGWEPPARTVDVWSFGDQPEMAARLAHLVACGEKRVTMGWVAAAEKDGTPLAHEGGISVVTDGYGYPRLVLRTVGVRRLPFEAIDAATAAGEGEGDLSHGDWREGHEAYFAGEAARLGLVFDAGQIISVERFEVLRRV